MPSGIYTTSIKRCVIPHYRSDEGDNLFDSLRVNEIFESESAAFRKYGNKLSACIPGMCIADLFYQFGLYVKDDYIKTLFSNISCFRGKDSVVSYLVAGRPYKIQNSVNQTCPESVVFKKGCLIIPRPELMWSLLAINGDKIAVSNDPNNFKIYIHTFEAGERIGAIAKLENELKSHNSHLGFNSIVKESLKDDSKANYVTLNPFIYSRIKCYRCLTPDRKSLQEQYFLIHSMNLFYSQSLGAIAVIGADAKRILMYPPGTRESLCIEADKLQVGIPDKHTENISDWTIVEEGKNIGTTCVNFKYKLDDTFKKLPENVIVFPEARSGDECKTLRENFHNFIQQYEHSHISKIRDEYSDIRLDFKIPDCFDDNQQKFFYKIIKNSYPSELRYKDDVISKFSPNCRLTPVGIVAIRNICENDPLIFQDNVMQIDQINLPNVSTPWTCNVEKLDIPEYKRLSDTEKAGESESSRPRVQASPLVYTPHFVTALGTNISLLPANN